MPQLFLKYVGLHTRTRFIDRIMLCFLNFIQIRKPVL